MKLTPYNQKAWEAERDAARRGASPYTIEAFNVAEVWARQIEDSLSSGLEFKDAAVKATGDLSNMFGVRASELQGARTLLVAFWEHGQAFQRALKGSTPAFGHR